MSKSISAGLLTDIQRQVTTLATLMVITRRDGRPFRLTNHDTDIVFDGHTYRHDIPFALSAIDSGSSLSIDNTELTLYADGTTFVLDEFAAGLFDFAEVEVFKINYENTANGKMTMRRGWFGRIERNRNRVMNITLTGMLKLLDFETGRTYQPSCDADLGDKRCKVAIDFSQIRSPLNPTHVVDWVYHYDPALMTAVPITNGDFEADGDRTEAQVITGWTKGPGSAFFVAQHNTSPTYGAIGTLDPIVGSRALYGSQDATAGDSGFENYLYQDIDLVASGISGASIDDGKVMMAYFAYLGQTVYLEDPVRLRAELIDANGEVVSAFDSRYIFLDKTEVWRERGLVFPVYPDTRYVRIYIYMRKEDGLVANCAADNVRVYHWDHTLVRPYDDVIHRSSRLPLYGFDSIVTPSNPGFEADGTIANSNAPTITGWTQTGYWQVDNTLGSSNALTVSEGSYFLGGGDNGSGVQSNYVSQQTLDLTTVSTVDMSIIALGKMVGRFSVKIGFAGPGTSKATASIECLNSSNVVLDTFYLLNNANYGGVTGAWQDNTVDFAFPPTTTKLRFTLTAHSPTGQSFAGVGFDAVKVNVYNAERPTVGDNLIVYGSSATVFDTTVGNYTFDNGIIWKAMPAYAKYDVVASVTSRKEFIATTMTGVVGVYETGVIWWISGANAGLKNVVRIWTPDDQRVKMYFRQPFDIQPGDRFIYIRSCSRRFTEDCLGVFQNQINFRAFPHLPGKLRDATDAENAAESG